MASNYSYPMRVAIGFDQFVNTLLGGEPDETVSARLHRHRNLPGWRVGRILVDGFFFWQWRPTLGGHCRQSWQAEMDRAQLPPAYRHAHSKAA